MHAWLPWRDRFLQEFLRFDGRGYWRDMEQCPLCGDGSPIIRCNDCFGRQLVCVVCARDHHRASPFHRIQVGFFRPCL